jgi:nucleoside-diphosphate-sugar epimerase
MPKAFIIGGTGQIGIATAAELLRRGWSVTLGHTGRRTPQNIPAGADLAVINRTDAATLRNALGTGVDALIDTMAFRGADADQLIGLRNLYGHLTVISSAGIYQDGARRSLETLGTLGPPEFDGPLAEDSDTVPPGPESYSSGKVELEQRLLDTPIPLAIIRPAPSTASTRSTRANGGSSSACSMAARASRSPAISGLTSTPAPPSTSPR